MSLWTSLEPASSTVDPGGSVRVRLRLRNTGDVVDEYRFEPVGDVAPWTTYEALSKLDKRVPARPSVHLAKALTAEVHWEVRNAAHDVHAGVGSDTQYGLAKHSYMSRSLYGFLRDPRWHRQELARVLEW